MEAQYSWGYELVSKADVAGAAHNLGASGRSPMADVGFALCTCTERFLAAQQTEMRRRGHLKTKLYICG
jgi:hypothetical protein